MVKKQTYLSNICNVFSSVLTAHCSLFWLVQIISFLSGNLDYLFVWHSNENMLKPFKWPKALCFVVNIWFWFAVTFHRSETYTKVHSMHSHSHFDCSFSPQCSWDEMKMDPLFAKRLPHTEFYCTIRKFLLRTNSQGDQTSNITLSIIWIHFAAFTYSCQNSAFPYNCKCVPSETPQWNLC